MPARQTGLWQAGQDMNSTPEIHPGRAACGVPLQQAPRSAPVEKGRRWSDVAEESRARIMGLLGSSVSRGFNQF